MRADRLVAILLLLQQRGRVTAAEVAEELEISERTARRDLDALGTAGLPVYSRQGRGGGWQLLGDGTTDLSGLSESEARALFRVAGPASSATPEVRAALRKLVRALPEPFRSGAEATVSSVVVDPAGWDSPGARSAPPTQLDEVQRVVVEGEQIVLGYVARDRASTSRVVHPLGLAAKGQVWYLVGDTEAGLRTFRVDRITSIEPIGAPVVRPAGFDLADAWRLIADEVEQKRTPISAVALADPEVIWLLRMMFGTRVRIGPTVPDGRVELELRGHSVPSLAGEVAGLGARVEVLEPAAMREALATIAADLTRVYSSNHIGLRLPTMPV